MKHCAFFQWGLNVVACNCIPPTLYPTLDLELIVSLGEDC